MRILIVDDSATVRFMMTRTLSDLGHEVRSVTDGLQALEAVAEDRPDVLVSDWMMPGIDGDELCRRLRADGGRYVYLILLTSLDGRDDVLAGMRAGADGYLTKPFEPADLEAALIAAERVTELHRELARLNAALYEEARTDPLTGVGNRLRMTEELRAFAARAERYGEPFALVLFDIDRFKRLNDLRGHQAGDAALHALAQALAGGLRDGDAIFRYGGEELLAVLAGQDPAGALLAADRLRALVEEQAIPHPANDGVGVVTVSAGVAAAAPGAAVDVETLLREADQALYVAKERGRNRVAAAGAQGD
jgi:two-component system chemotaxis response regulator CheY